MKLFISDRNGCNYSNLGGEAVLMTHSNGIISEISRIIDVPEDTVSFLAHLEGQGRFSISAPSPETQDLWSLGFESDYD